MVTPFLVFEKPPYCFTQWLQQVTFPSTMYEELPVLHILSNIVIRVPLDDGHSDMCGSISLWF